MTQAPVSSVLVVMTTEIDVLGLLRTEWLHLGRTSRSCEAMARLAGAHPELQLNQVADLTELITLLEPHGGRTSIERARIVQALLEEASCPALHRALLQTLIPGIVSTCRQLRFGQGIISNPSDMLSCALSYTSELISLWAGQSRPYCGPDLLSALRGRLRRWMLNERDVQIRLSYFENNDFVAKEESPLLARLDSFRGSSHERLARLTFERVFEGRPLLEVAKREHVAPLTLQRDLQQFAKNFLL